jgi:hypothetical protein
MVSFYDSDLEASGAEPLAQQATASLHYGGRIFLYRFAGCKVSPFASLKIELPSRIESFRKQNSHQNQGGKSHEVFF